MCKYEGKKLSRSEKWGTKVKIRLVFQLEEVNPETKRRFQVQVFFGQSMFKGKSGMSNLRKYVESWRGRAFSEQDEIHWLTEPFDTVVLLDRGAQIQVNHTIQNGGQVYANVVAIVPLPKGMQDPPFQPEFYPGEMERWAADTKEAEDFEASEIKRLKPKYNTQGKSYGW